MGEHQTTLLGLRSRASQAFSRHQDLVKASSAFDSGEPLWFKMGGKHATPWVRDLRKVHAMRTALEGATSFDEELTLVDKFHKELAGYRRTVSLRRKHLLLMVQWTLQNRTRPKAIRAT